jgi:hypothetical protein
VRASGRFKVARARTTAASVPRRSSVTGHPGVPLQRAHPHHHHDRRINGSSSTATATGRSSKRELTPARWASRDSYRWPDDVGRADTIKGLGNAVCPPVARDVVAQVIAAA